MFFPGIQWILFPELNHLLTQNIPRILVQQYYCQVPGDLGSVVRRAVYLEFQFGVFMMYFLLLQI